MKYKPGDRLKINNRETARDTGLSVGDILTVIKSKKYPDLYAFKETIEKDKDPGWLITFIENKSNFKKIKTNWREKLNNQRM